MKRWVKSVIFAGLCAIASANAAAAQVTPEEANTKLREKQQQRAAAATQPSTITQKEADDLRRLVVQLRAENEALKREIAAMKATAAAPAAPPPATKSGVGKYAVSGLNRNGQGISTVVTATSRAEAIKQMEGKGFTKVSAHEATTADLDAHPTLASAGVGSKAGMSKYEDWCANLVGMTVDDAYRAAGKVVARGAISPSEPTLVGAEADGIKTYSMAWDRAKYIFTVEGGKIIAFEKH